MTPGSPGFGYQHSCAVVGAWGAACEMLLVLRWGKLSCLVGLGEEGSFP